MIKTIYSENNLISLAPSILKSREENVIKLEVIEKTIKKHIIDNIKYLVFLDRIQKMNEEELDIVTEELHVDYYDSSMSIEEKRMSCYTSLDVHKIKGTPAAIKKILNIFFKDSLLQQWYEYDGVPGRFKVQIKGEAPENLFSIIDRIETSKKKSQHIEEIRFISKSDIIIKPVFLTIQEQNHIINAEAFSINLKYKEKEK